ncbi:hypothetical protein [Streptococcus sp. S784/96/1]|uniref:hypothetical protein n=1 Tax=Streptococcus sp. S784/96/1 TaxID=2653499 RepID=UPI0013866E14|nr:hypothetical protein [Streptococcus sp. S784/96/1]
MIELYFVYNGYRKRHLGSFEQVQSAVTALKAHQASNSAITNPTFVKSMSGDNIRIDYGARDCYYLMTKNRRGEL